MQTADDTLNPDRKDLYFYEDELLQWIESGRKQMQAMSLQEQAAEIVHGAKRKPKGGYNF